MKTSILLLLASLVSSILSSTVTLAQLKVATVTELKEYLMLKPGETSRVSHKRTIITSNNPVKCYVNYSAQEDGGIQAVVGEVIRSKGSLISFRFEGNSLKEGQVLIPKTRKAYQYYSDAQEDVWVREANIDTIISKSPGK